MLINNSYKPELELISLYQFAIFELILLYQFDTKFYDINNVLSIFFLFKLTFKQNYLLKHTVNNSQTNNFRHILSFPVLVVSRIT